MHQQSHHEQPYGVSADNAQASTGTDTDRVSSTPKSRACRTHSQRLPLPELLVNLVYQGSEVGRWLECILEAVRVACATTRRDLQVGASRIVYRCCSCSSEARRHHCLRCVYVPV